MRVGRLVNKIMTLHNVRPPRTKRLWTPSTDRLCANAPLSIYSTWRVYLTATEGFIALPKAASTISRDKQTRCSHLIFPCDDKEGREGLPELLARQKINVTPKKSSQVLLLSLTRYIFSLAAECRGMNNSCDFPRVHCDAKSGYTCGEPTFVVFFHFCNTRRSARFSLSERSCQS